MIPSSDKALAVKLILEAQECGARLWKAFDVLEISRSTFERWRSGKIHDQRKGAIKNVPRKLSAEEEEKIVQYCNSPEYMNDNPYKIHASLLDKGEYIASISSFYRVLKKNKLIQHRSNTRPGTGHSRPEERRADGPNQVWCWDITWLPTKVRGIFLYAYVIIDVWDRSIVKWAIHEREDDTLAQELFYKAFSENGMPDVFVHSDNGNPMKGVSLLALFQDLGICNGYSRPRISNDNPFIESWFKTLKYHVKFPGRFEDKREARVWFASFVHFYNNKHSHSGLHFITPNELRSGKYEQIVSGRNVVMDQAFKKNPQRWSKGPKQLPEHHIVYLNPTADTRIRLKKLKDAS